MTVLIDWNDVNDGWRWLLHGYGATSPADWETVEFDDAGWCPGGVGGFFVGAMVMGVAAGDNCEGYGQPYGSGGWVWAEGGTIRTPWPEYADLYVRRRFTVPEGTTQLTFDMRIDNQMWLYLDGEFIAYSEYAADGYPTNPAGTNPGPHIVTDPALIEPGEHVMAWFARNYSPPGAPGPNYATVRVVATP